MSCCYQPSHICSLPESHKSRTSTQSKYFTQTYFRAPLIHLTQFHCFLTLLPLPATPFQKQDPFSGKQRWGPTSRNASWPFRDLPGSGARVSQTGSLAGLALPRTGDGTLTDCPVPRFQPTRRKFNGAKEGEDNSSRRNMATLHCPRERTSVKILSIQMLPGKN